MLSLTDFLLSPLPGGAACRVTRLSVVTGELVTCEFPLPLAEMRERMQRWLEGDGHVQEVFRMLTADYREFLVSGIPPGEWQNIVGPEREGKAAGAPDPVEEPAF